MCKEIEIQILTGTPCTVYEFMTTCDTAPLIDIGMVLFFNFYNFKFE